MASKPRPRVEIEYCTQCGWLLRAAWMAQELRPERIWVTPTADVVK
jgi:predicted Rdx family selenoprotein